MAWSVGTPSGTSSVWPRCVRSNCIRRTRAMGSLIGMVRTLPPLPLTVMTFSRRAFSAVAVSMRKVTDEWYMELSTKYQVEKLDLKNRMAEIRERLQELTGQRHSAEQFIATIRRFMEMNTLTGPLLKELIDHIDVYEMEGSGKSKTQRVAIYYRFVGYIELPEGSYFDRLREDVRQGVAVEYIPEKAKEQAEAC